MKPEQLKDKIVYATAVFSKEIAKDYEEKNKNKGLIMMKVIEERNIAPTVEGFRKDMLNRKNHSTNYILERISYWLGTKK